MTKVSKKPGTTRLIVTEVQLSRLNANIPSDLYRKFKAASVLNQVTINDLIQDWVEKYVEENITDIYQFSKK